MRGNEIIVSSEPQGKFMEGYISGSGAKPGMLVQLKAGVEMIGGRFTYELYNVAADGEQRSIWVLMNDYLQGKTTDHTYADGDRIFIYRPAPGDELNVMAADVAGTGDDITIGMLFMADDGTGKIVRTTGSPESEAFECLETVTDPVADQLLHVRYTGY